MADPSPHQWAAAVLGRLGIHQTPGAVQALAGWARAEGGHWNNSARYNPLNTTQPAPGAGNTGSQGNIKVYRSWGQGINATAQTLTNGRYGNILAALKAGDPARVASAIGQSPWGTSAATARSAILGTPQVSGVDGTALLHDAAHDHLSQQVNVQLAQRKTFDQAGFDQARRKFVLGSMIARHEPNSILLRSGVLSTSAPSPGDFESSRLTSKTITSGGGGSPSGGGGSAAADFASQRVGRYQENLGSNRGSELDVLENRFGMRGQPWCAIFATTAASHGGAPSSVRTASVAQIRQWASEGSHGYARGLLPADAAQPGDLLTFGDAHVGVVQRRLSDGRIQTVEGNTSTGGVRKVIRSPGEGQVARPVYVR